MTSESIHQYVIDSDEENPDSGYLHEIKEKEKWDCESILSTYSNIYNHPKLITEPVRVYLFIILLESNYSKQIFVVG